MDFYKSVSRWLKSQLEISVLSVFASSNFALIDLASKLEAFPSAGKWVDDDLNVYV